MIQIKGFPNYFFCQKSCGVYSIRKGEIKKIKPEKGQTKSFRLYKYGVKHGITLFQIIKICIPAIEELERDAF